ncbi:MAG: hypothetical protein ABIK10_01110 [candidate division WOR-3 bacterium]
MKITTRENSISRRLTNFLIILLFLLSLVVFFLEIFLKKGYFWEDFLEQNYPYRLFAACAIRERVFPFWNPYIFGGLPFFADVQTGVLFPGNLLLTLFTVGRWLTSYVVEIFMLLHLLIAGIGMFYFARELKFSDITAFFMGQVYMLNGHFIVQLTHTQQVQTLVFIPWVFLFLQRAFEPTSDLSFWRAILGCGLILGIAGLAGYPQIIVIILLGIFLWVIYYVITTSARRWKIILGLIVILIIFGLIVACQYIPSYFLFKDSIRGLYTYEEIVEGSFHPWRFITFFVPNFFGTTAQGLLFNFWGPGNYYQYWEQMFYLGILPIIFCGLAFSLARARKNLVLPLILGFIPLLIGLGKYAPVHILFYKYVPFFKDIRTPAKFLNLTLFALVWLSGIGLENFIHLRPRSKYLNIAGGVLIIVLLGLIVFVPKFPGWSIAIKDLVRVVIILILGLIVMNLYLRQTLKVVPFGILIILIAFLDLFTFGYKYNSSPVEPDYYWRDDQLTSFFRREAQREFIRVNIRAPEGMLLPRNIGYVLEFPTVDGYNPLILRRYFEVQKKLATDRFFDLMSVKYITYYDTTIAQLNIKPNENYLPRAQVYYNWEVIPNQDSLLMRLNDPTFPIDKSIILEEPIAGLTQAPNYPATDAKIVSYSLNNVKIQVETPRPGILVLRDNYYRNWQVKVNERRQKVFPVNYCLRGCVVPEGRSTVEFFYEEKYFNALLVVSITTIVLCFVGTILLRSRRKGNEQVSCSIRDSL